MASRLTDDEYVRQVEMLAHAVVEAAAAEGWLNFGEQGREADIALRRAVNALATELRFVHHQADSCLDRAQLNHLARAYFHQDYDLEFVDPDAAVVAFVMAEGQGASRELASEIAVLIGTSSEEELAELWLRSMGASYDPTAHGHSCREWFEHVRAVAESRVGDSWIPS